MKILEICNFSSGVSGVWTRALEDARGFIEKGHEVYIFSSNEKETGEVVSLDQELKEEIHIIRFPVKRKNGYALWFDFEKEALELKPDVIICHGLRKPYLNVAIKVAKKINAKCFCITHAPFIEKDLRSKKLNLFVWIYDKFVGKRIMNSFDKIIAICKWEKEELVKLGCDEERIVYLPNSLPSEFFADSSINEQKKILFLGRMHPVKELEILIEAFKKLELDYELEIVSSKGGDYYESLQKLKSDKIKFTSPIYDLDKKIQKIDEAEIFVLPSMKESLPFGIIEAMARGKIVVTTKTKGGIELVDHLINGFLFNIGNSIELELILSSILKLKEEHKLKIKNAARKKAEEFKLSKNMEGWEELFKK